MEKMRTVGELIAQLQAMVAADIGLADLPVVINVDCGPPGEEWTERRPPTITARTEGDERFVLIEPVRWGMARLEPYRPI